MINVKIDLVNLLLLIADQLVLVNVVTLLTNRMVITIISQVL